MLMSTRPQSLHPLSPAFTQLAEFQTSKYGRKNVKIFEPGANFEPIVESDDKWSSEKFFHKTTKVFKSGKSKNGSKTSTATNDPCIYEIKIFFNVSCLVQNFVEERKDLSQSQK